MTDASSSSSPAAAPAPVTVVPGDGAAAAAAADAATAAKDKIEDLIVTMDNFKVTIPEITLGNKMQKIKSNGLKYLNAGRKGDIRGASVYLQATVDSRLGIRDSTMDDDKGDDAGSGGKEKKSGGKKRKSDKKKAASDDEEEEDGGKKVAAPAAPGAKKRTYALGFGVDDNRWDPILDALHAQLVLQAQRKDVRDEVWKPKKGQPAETDQEIFKHCKSMAKVSDDEKKAAEYGATVNLQLEDDPEYPCVIEKKIGTSVDDNGDIVTDTAPVSLDSILTKPGRFTFNAKLVRIVAKHPLLSYKWKIAYVMWEPPVKKPAPPMLGMKIKRVDTNKPAAPAVPPAAGTAGTGAGSGTSGAPAGGPPAGAVIGATAAGGAATAPTASGAGAGAVPGAATDGVVSMDIVKTPTVADQPGETKQAPVGAVAAASVEEPVVQVSVTSNNSAPLGDEAGASGKARKSGSKKRTRESPHAEGESTSKRQRTGAAGGNE